MPAGGWNANLGDYLGKHVEWSESVFAELVPELVNYLQPSTSASPAPSTPATTPTPSTTSSRR